MSLKTWYSAVFIFFVLFSFACSKTPNDADKKPNQNAVKDTTFSLVQTAASSRQWTGVAVSQGGRIFVNYPRWSPNVTASVSELVKDQGAQVYPDETWNLWSGSEPPEQRFICVQSVYVDQNNFLWVLDPANALFQGVVQNGAKLLKIDLQTNQVIQTIIFNETAAPANSYLNDVRVDVNTNTAYITDSGMGALLIVNLADGTSRRVLDYHRSTTAESILLNINGREIEMSVHSDGIALDTDNGYLYYMPLTGRNLYRIKTEYLRDSSISDSLLAEKVEHAGETGPSDGLLYKDGWVYLSSIEENSIKRINAAGKLERVVQNSLLEWPDSFSSPPGSDDIYVTTSRIGFPPGGQCRIFKLVQTVQ